MYPDPITHRYLLIDAPSEARLSLTAIDRLVAGSAGEGSDTAADSGAEQTHHAPVPARVRNVGLF